MSPRRRRPVAPVLLLALSACQARAPTPQRPPETPPPVATPAPADAGPPAPPEPPRSQEPAAASRTASRLGGALHPAWFLCEGTNLPRIAVVERDAAGTTATLTWLDKREGAPEVRQTYALGRADPGAGQIYFALSQKGQEVGNLHAVNPGMLSEPSRALTPVFGGLRVGEVNLTCRYLLGTRLMGFDGKRGVLVTQDAKGGLTYRSFDFADAAKAREEQPEGYGHTTTASQTVGGGTEARTPDGSTFSFQNGGYTYVLRVGGDASLEVLREGQSVQRSELLAWTYAPPPPAP